MRSILYIAKTICTYEDFAAFDKNDVTYIELDCERETATTLMDKVMDQLEVSDAFSVMRIGNWKDPGEMVSIHEIDWSR